MAYDPVRWRIVLFGGTAPNPSGVAGDTWEFGWLPTTATVVAFGAGCGQPPLAIAPAFNSRPVLGTTHVTGVVSVPAGISLMALGLSDTFLGGFPLPLPLDGLGMTGCLLYHDAVVSQLCSSVGPGAAQYGLPIPNNPVLMGAALFLQAWALAPGVNPAGIIVSNANELTIGNM